MITVLKEVSELDSNGYRRVFSYCVCNSCNREWKVRKSLVVDGYGCSKCKGITFSEIYEKLIVMGIKAVKVYKHRSPNGDSVRCVSCECIHDGHTWSTSLPNILSGYGCKVCSGHKMTPEIAKSRLENRGFEVSKCYYEDNKVMCECICKTCGHIMQGQFSKLNNLKGCSNCILISRRNSIESLEHSSMLNKFTVMSIYVKDKGYAKHTFAKCNCLLCGSNFEVSTTKLKYGKGCPHCVKNGFSVLKPSQFYYYRIGSSYIGFGITNDPNVRHGKHRSVFKKFKVSYELTGAFYGSGKDILALENHVKASMPIVDSKITGFRRECISVEYTDEFLISLQNFIKQKDENES